jgi:transcriptional regulator with XRE-family HTH domain
MKLADYIARKRMTQEAFADLVGVSQVSIARYIRGHRIPRPEVIQKIHRVTNGRVTANDFISPATERAA